MRLLQLLVKNACTLFVPVLTFIVAMLPDNPTALVSFLGIIIETPAPGRF
jgi:hypothetical protein